MSTQLISHIQEEGMNPRHRHFNGAELFLFQWLSVTTHKHRYCPFCHGRVSREKKRGFGRLTTLLGMRPYRCETCDRLHYGFRF